MSELPYINPDVQYVRVSRLRDLNTDKLFNLNKILVIQDPKDKPIAVLISYEQYMKMQDWLISLTVVDPE